MKRRGIPAVRPITKIWMGNARLASAVEDPVTIARASDALTCARLLKVRIWGRPFSPHGPKGRR